MSKVASRVIEFNSLQDELNAESDYLLFDLMNELQNIDIKSPLAKLNETTISDNNGGRIEL